jgi:hypothetical protein
MRNTAHPSLSRGSKPNSRKEIKMEVRRTVTYQQIHFDEETCIIRRRTCDLHGDKIIRVKAWRNRNGLVIVDLGNGDWLMPVIDHTGKLGSKKDREAIEEMDRAVNGIPEPPKFILVENPDPTNWEKLVDEATGELKGEGGDTDEDSEGA